MVSLSTLQLKVKFNFSLAGPGGRVEKATPPGFLGVINQWPDQKEANQAKRLHEGPMTKFPRILRNRFIRTWYI